MALDAHRTIAVEGSSGRTYLVRAFAFGAMHCTCPAWKFQSAAPDSRTCKHTRAQATIPTFSNA